MRILQVVGAMERGGAETWLMHVLRNIDRSEFEIDFVVHTRKECAYDAELRALGSRIFACPTPHNPCLYARDLYKVLTAGRPYDLVHSHVHHFTGVVLAVARAAGVPARIAHSHNDITHVQAGAVRRLYLRLAEIAIRRCATRGFAVSRPAAASLFGKQWEADPRWRTLYCGIDLQPFMTPPDRLAVRQEFEFSDGALVIGHVGRFSEQKNHCFFLRVAAAIAARRPGARFLLIGDGPLQTAIQQEACRLGLGKRVVFAGARSDVVRLISGMIDVLLFPSLYEGIPLVLLESQAAGVPAVISEVIADEARVIPSMLVSASLSLSTDQWADIVIRTAESPRALTPMSTLSIMEKSRFNIRASIEVLTGEYRRAQRQNPFAIAGSERDSERCPTRTGQV